VFVDASVVRGMDWLFRVVKMVADRGPWASSKAAIGGDADTNFKRDGVVALTLFTKHHF